MALSEIKLGSKIIGEGRPAYIIAELSANHSQNLEVAVKTIQAMASSGADAVKVQTYKPECMTLDSEQPWFQTRKDTLWAGQKLFHLYKNAAMPYEWHKVLQKTAHENNIDFFSSPFDFEAVDFLEELNVPAYKIASFEITHIPLIEYVAKKGRPVILSTGIATREDIELAVDTIRGAGNNQIILLKCTSAYPTPMEEVNLNLMKGLRDDFKVLTGLSDHTLGISVPTSAVSLGACIIEKHFILDNTVESVDKDFSLTAVEFKEMVVAVRNTEKMLGTGSYILTDKMAKARASSRSIFVIENMKKGDVLTDSNVGVLRPGLGIHPKYFTTILGKRALQDIPRGTPLSFDLFE